MPAAPLPRNQPRPLSRFIGIDLAWCVDRRHTGVAVMDGDNGGVRLVELSSGLHSLDGVIRFVLEHLSKDMVVAVDASLIVNNDAGQRPCETEIGRVFGKFGASCHSTNRGRRHFDSGERLVSNLAERGFKHGLPVETAKFRAGRCVIEVYPHPAMVRLFNLARIIRYKKGPVDGRRSGLQLLQSHLNDLTAPGRGLRPSKCLDELLGTNPALRSGASLKRHEDLLDAVFCAYLAWHFWRWGGERNEVFGDLRTGYVVVPGHRAAVPRLIGS